MIEKKNKQRLDFQSKMIARQSEQIDSLKLEIQNLKQECKKKDEIIKSIEPLKSEMSTHVSEIKEYKKRYLELINELRKMKEIVNQEVYRGRWWLIRLLIK